jgi:hypothetical protein
MHWVSTVTLLISAQVIPLPPLAIVPAAIRVPDGHRLVATYSAKGEQVYVATKGTGGELEWKFEGPRAHLKDVQRGDTATHSSGPSWESADGSKIVKPPAAKAVAVVAKNPETDIPWLLIPVNSADFMDGKPGKLSNVVYVQRLSTSGGVAPATPPKRVGTNVAVPYTALYTFWAKPDLELQHGKLVVTGSFSEAEAYGKRFTVAADPGQSYTITREGAASWFYLYDGAGKAISNGWSGDYVPKFSTYYHQPDRKEAFRIFLPGGAGDFKLTITSQPVPKPKDVVWTDGKFEDEAKFAQADGVYSGYKQKSYVLKASKGEKFRIEIDPPSSGPWVVVRDRSGNEMAIKDRKDRAGKALAFTRRGGTEDVSFEAPEDGTYRIGVVISHSSKAPEESLIAGRFRIRMTQE